MKLEEFINVYDKINSIVLLEGKRTVLTQDIDKLITLGKLLTEKTTYMAFRSGNADGADYFFSQGVAAVDKTRLQVITPYFGHRKKYNQANETISLEQVDLTNEPDIIHQSKQNKKTSNIIDTYVSGKVNSKTISAAYIIRDTIKVLGTKEILQASFGIFYDDLATPRKGGTGHTMSICEKNNIPLINQEIWFGWLNE